MSFKEGNIVKFNKVGAYNGSEHFGSVGQLARVEPNDNYYGSSELRVSLLSPRVGQSKGIFIVEHARLEKI